MIMDARMHSLSQADSLKAKCLQWRHKY